MSQGDTQLTAFRRDVLRIWYQTLRRRSQRSRLTWEAFQQSLGKLIPPVQTRHPYPNVRYDAKQPNIQGKNRVR